MPELVINLKVSRKELQTIENALFNHLKYLEEEMDKNPNNTTTQRVAALELRPTQELLQTFRGFHE